MRENTTSIGFLILYSTTSTYYWNYLLYVYILPHDYLYSIYKFITDLTSIFFKNKILSSLSILIFTNASTKSATETYTKVKGVRHYVWFVMNALKKSILDYQIIENSQKIPFMS